MIFVFFPSFTSSFNTIDPTSQLMQDLDENFGSLISQLSIEKYGGLSSIILEKLEHISVYKANDLNPKEKKFIIHFIDIFIQNSTYGKNRLSSP